MDGDAFDFLSLPSEAQVAALPVDESLDPINLLMT